MAIDPGPESPARLPRPPVSRVAPDIALFLDVDGTLLEFADHPAAVSVAEPLIDRLSVLHQRLGGALALVSGRALSTLDALFWPTMFPAAGLHGLEVRDASGRLDRLDVPRTGLARLRRGMRRLSRRYPELLLEDKGGCIALHYRRNPGLAMAVLDEVRELARHIGDDFTLQPGDHVVEMRSSMADKGRAVRILMTSPPFSGRRPIVLGDDLTDEHAFAAAERLGGCGIVVGARRPTCARYALRDPNDVWHWLGSL